MLTPEQLIEIEAACDQCSAGFGQQRADAERFVVALRGADNAIEMAHFIIGHSKNDNACFHAAVMMKEATMRNWHTTAPEERSKIKANLLQHVLQPRVRSGLTSVHAGRKARDQINFAW